MSKKPHFSLVFWPIIGICALALASCGGSASGLKPDAAAPIGAKSPDAQVVIVYVTPDAAPSTCACVCADPCTCSCDCGTGEPIVVQTPGCIPTANDDAAMSTPPVFADAAPPTPQEDAAPSAPDAPIVPIVDAAAPDIALTLDASSAKDANMTDAQTAAGAADAPGLNSDGSPDQKKDVAAPDSVDAQCSVGSTRQTYSGPSGTVGVGICQPQVEACDQSGAYVVKQKEVLPQKEIPWDGIDQDCNGTDLLCPIYVDGNAIDAGAQTGAPTSPWTTIQAALDNFTSCDTIVVRRGTYHDQVSCHDCDIEQGCGIKTIKSEEGAVVTIIDRIGHSADEKYGFMLYGCSITIEGFTIANADTGIDVFSNSETTVIQHNIFLHNTEGILVVYGPGDGSPVIIRNNIIIGDPSATTGPYAGTGIGEHQYGGLRRIENNLIIGERGTSSTSAGVFIDNWATGYVQNNIIADGYNGILKFYDYNTMTTQYNCLFGNSHDYASYEVAGIGDVHSDPVFVSPVDGSVGATTDFHLSPNSPCRNAGNPDPAFNNPDGTRNDIGPYGGPFGVW